MTRVLEVVSALNCGGVEKLLLNYVKKMPLNDFEIDFVVFDRKNTLIANDFEQLGCKIFYVTRIRENYFKMCSELDDIIKNGNYDIVHCHQGYLSFPAINIARKYKVPLRISHSHFAFVPETKIKTLFRKVLTFFVKKNSTNLYACGKDAGIWAWGEKTSESGKVCVMNNAINVPDFVFDADTREIKRKELGVEDKFVIGNVGRMCFQKNQEFLLRVFADIYSKKEDAVLLLIGDGENMEETVELAQSLNISDRVKFLGVRKDVNELLNAMDVFVLPSRFEGLPVTLVEAQCNGLKCFAADTITREVAVGESVEYLSINNTEKLWSDNIIEKNERISPQDAVENVRNSGYDINVEVQKLVDFYQTSRKVVL